MSDLRAPLGKIADAPVDEVTVQRMWRAIGKRRARSQGSASPWALRGAVVLAACVALALLVRFAAHRDAGPLHQAGGAELANIEGTAAPTVAGAPVGAPIRVDLDDGSSLLVAANARMKTLENTSTSLVTLLETGRVTFDVRPGGPRRWIIECGLATVEVVGTRFTVDRSPHHGRVEVERGVVLVRGELVKDRIRRLTAGESLDIDDLAADALAPAPSSAPVAGARASIDRVPAANAVKATSSAPPAEGPEPWRDLARKGAFKEAYRAITMGASLPNPRTIEGAPTISRPMEAAPSNPSSVAQEAKRASVDDLLLLADVARLSGHSSEAVAPLLRVIDEQSGDPRASMAAFTLGRIQLDALGQAAAAAQTFSRAIAMGLPQGLREDAYARVVEARARAGDRAGARAAAAEYQASYPSGSRLAEVRAWAERE
jgi:transmembrane sensor